MTSMRELVSTLLPQIRQRALAEAARPESPLPTLRKPTAQPKRIPAVHRPKTRRNDDYASNM